MDLYCKETGKENLQTIIFLHEINMAGWMWEGQVTALNDYHCLIPDLPEHGRSNEIYPFTINKSAELIIDLIKNKANKGKAHLVGISLGAQIILQILNKAPEVADHVLISGAPVNFTKPTEDFLKLFNYLMKVYIPVKNDNLIIGSYIRSYGIPKNLIKKFKESIHIINEESAERIIREHLLFPMPLNLEKIEVPVLVMAGEKDYKFIKESTRRLINTLPNSKSYLAPKVGHMWNIENNELFNQILRSWITEKRVKS